MKYLSQLLWSLLAIIPVIASGQQSQESPDWALFFDTEEGAAAVTSAHLSDSPAETADMSPELARWMNDKAWIERIQNATSPRRRYKVFWGNQNRMLAHVPESSTWIYSYRQKDKSSWKFNSSFTSNSREFEDAKRKEADEKRPIPGHPWIFRHPVNTTGNEMIMNSILFTPRKASPEGERGTWYLGHKLSTITGLFAEGDHPHGLKLRIDLSEEEPSTPIDTGLVEYRKIQVLILGLNSEWTAEGRGYFMSDIQFGYMKLFEQKIGEIHLIAGPRLLIGDISLINLGTKDDPHFSYEIRFPQISLRKSP